jgi:hypothetical protein
LSIPARAVRRRVEPGRIRATDQEPTMQITSARAGRVLSALPILFLTFDAAIKLLAIPAVAEGSRQLGYPPESMFGIGAVLLACVALYAVPRTAVLGAVLLTGYLGGAIATHVRVGNPAFSHTLFPVYVAAFVWGGLFLRDARVRALVGAAR